MRGKLTVALIERTRIPAGKSQIVLWDAAVSGLQLRVLLGGAKTWQFRYRADGGGRSARLRTVRLGSWPTLSIEGAMLLRRMQ